MTDVATEIAAYAHGRVPRGLRERQILQLAEELFAERGYERASMDELAARAGVTKPVIYGLVGNKEELFRRCLRHAGDELAARVSHAVLAQTGDREKLLAGTTAFFAWVADRRGLWQLFQAGRAGRFTDETNAIFARQTDLVAGFMIEIAGAAPLDAEVAAHAINGASDALARWWPEHPELTAEDMAGRLVDLVWPGLELLRP
jgi:AcrR family transcriptional regulator